MLQAKDVSHVYDADERVEALRNINITIDRGNIGAIVGSSGCGKTTLLRILGGLLAPTSGTIEIDGDLVRGIPSEVGIIFQDYDNTLLKWKSVFANVAIGAEMGGSQNVEETTNHYLQLVGLDEFSRAMPRELSGGMKQRVQVARLLAYGPSLLLCDEPFGALDAQTKETLQDELLRILHKENITTVFVTHDIEEAIYLGDMIFVFTAKQPGRIDRTIDVEFERPRFPKERFEACYAKTITETKSRIKELMSI